MIGVRDDDRQYRRGMVLGLTMAEIMLLLIFLLLLLLSAKLLADRKAVTDAVSERDRAIAAKVEAEKKLAALDPILREIKRKNSEAYSILEEWQKAQEEFAETQKKLEEAQSAMELLEPVKKNKPDMNNVEAKAEAQRLIEVAQALERQAAEMSPDANPKEALEHLQEAAMVGDMALKSGKTPGDLIAGATCQKDLSQCKQSNVDMANKLALKGGTLPSCWVNDITGRPQYIFTAFLRPDGIYLQDNKIPGREAEQAKLPIAPLTFGRAYQASEFVHAGEKILQWSDQQKPACRFYVRIVDELPNDKLLYRQLSERGVERVFFPFPVN
jgi:hypothetical protein